MAIAMHVGSGEGSGEWPSWRIGPVSHVGSAWRPLTTQLSAHQLIAECIASSYIHVINAHGHT